MPFLSQGTTDATAAPQAGEGHDLPATFSEGFGAAWQEGRLFGQSVAGENARMDALQDHIADIKDRTGKDVSQGVDWTTTAPGVGPVPMPAAAALDQVNAAAQKIGEPELTPDDLEQKAVAKSRAAQTASADFATREQTFGSKLGTFAGGAAASATDPINILALPVAPEAESVSIVAAALRWGAVGAVAQAGIEATGAPYHEEVQPGYVDSGAPLVNVAQAFLGGAALGGITKGLGNAWTRVKTGAWPQSVRDAGNVIESHANVADTNAYRGAAGEAAHADAMSGSIDNILNEKPIDVSAQITPEIEAAQDTRLNDILSAREQAITAQGQAQAERSQLEATAAPGLPFEQTAKEAQAEGHVGDMAFGIQGIARDAGYAMDRAEAETVAQKIMKMHPDEAQDALRDLQMSPRQVAEAPVARAAPPPEPREPVTDPAKALASPDFEQSLRADIDRERMAADRQIPVDVDKDGEPVYRSLDGAMDEVDAYHNAADQIAACAAPAAAEEEAA